MISESTLRLLEFHKLLSYIAQHTHSEISARMVREIRPVTDHGTIIEKFGQIKEIRSLSDEHEPLRLSFFDDITPLLSNVKPEGAVIDARELALLFPVLTIGKELSGQLSVRPDLIYLSRIAMNITGFPDVLDMLKNSIDNEGNILDGASFVLRDIRSRIRKIEAKVRKKLEELVRNERVSVFLQDEFITTRSGRWVIPVRMDSKGMVPGVVHDVSKSGETAFIEPLDIIHVANELENLIADQKAEEIRILRHISSVIRDVAGDIEREFGLIVYLDTLCAICKVAEVLKMEIPQICEGNNICIHQGRHPLLQLALLKKEHGGDVIPLNLEMGRDDRVMVITGANAGGKTIAIKTVGILLLMGMSGMPVPASSTSCFPLIRNLLVDIGDEQSIESSLSTFSAHISNITEMLRMVDKHSVVLIDELGTGTDPEEGAAIACAILSETMTKGAMVFATTHLSDIKGYVHRTRGMMNAAMEFDRETMTPLYSLRVGEPGPSHALQTASRYGLPAEIIDSAKGLLGTRKAEFDSLIADLNMKRKEYQHAREDLKKREEEVHEKGEQIAQLLSDAESSKKGILAEAYREASEIIAQTKRRMYLLLDQIKRSDREHRKKAIKETEILQQQVNETLREYEDKDSDIPEIGDIKVGDVVFVTSLGYDASVLHKNMKTQRLRVFAGGLEIEVPVSDIRHKREKALRKGQVAYMPEREKETVMIRLNIVGLRVDEALSKLEPFLNHSVLSEMHEVTIIHGIGKGLLRRAVHDHLEGHPLVKSFRDGSPEEGGAGVTIVVLG